MAPTFRSSERNHRYCIMKLIEHIRQGFAIKLCIVAFAETPEHLAVTLLAEKIILLTEKQS